MIRLIKSNTCKIIKENADCVEHGSTEMHASQNGRHDRLIAQQNNKAIKNEKVRIYEYCNVYRNRERVLQRLLVYLCAQRQDELENEKYIVRIRAMR